MSTIHAYLQLSFVCYMLGGFKEKISLTQKREDHSLTEKMYSLAKHQPDTILLQHRRCFFMIGTWITLDCKCSGLTRLTQYSKFAWSIVIILLGAELGWQIKIGGKLPLARFIRGCEISFIWDFLCVKEMFS